MLQRASSRPIQAAQPAQASTEIRVPTNRQELNALVGLREELRGQLRSITRLRQELTNQIAQAEAVNDGSAARDLRARVRTLDARSSAIEQQILDADQAVTNAVARGVTVQEPVVAVAAPAAPLPPRIIQVGGAEGGLSPDVFAGAMLGAALLFTFVGSLITRRAWRRAEKTKGALAGDATQLHQLQQAVDVIAVEVERIAEGQRYVSRLLSERLEGITSDARERVLVSPKGDASGSGR